MSARCQLVIFDSDGTLVDSERVSMSVWVEMAAEVGVVVDLDDAVSRWSGQNLNVVIGELAAFRGAAIPDSFLDDFRIRQTARLAAEVTPIDGAADVLRALTSGTDAVACRVASNAPRAKVELCLETCGLLEFFDSEHIFSAYDLGVWNPEPDLFQHVAATVGVTGQQCAVVEDSDSGVAAGVAAGMEVFAYDPHAHFTSTGGVTSMEDLRQLLDHLD